jgi:Cu/Ag efflux pump CusA
MTRAFAERLDGGSYIDVGTQREQVLRYGINIADAPLVVSSATSSMG